MQPRRARVAANTSRESRPSRNGTPPRVAITSMAPPANVTGIPCTATVVV